MIHSVLLALASEENELAKIEAGDFSILKNKTCEEIKVLIDSMNTQDDKQTNIMRRIFNSTPIHIKTNFI